jgi:hypothetical protein
MHCSGKIARSRQMARSAEQQGRVPIMAAGMHLSRNRRLVGPLGLLGHGQRIHVGSQANSSRAVADLQRPHDTGLSQAAMDANAGLFQQVDYDPARPLFLEPQLRMGMKVLAKTA